jgi:hypothetical protein
VGEENEEWARSWKWWTVVSTCIFVVVLLFHLVAYLVIFSWQGADRGTFGDMFGATNSVLSGLAFVGLLITLVMQRTELCLQRKDLKLQYEEMKESRVQLEHTAKAQQAMLEIAKAEHAERLATERRSATMLLEWSKRDLGASSELPGGYELTATNVGQLVIGLLVANWSTDNYQLVELKHTPILASGAKTTMTIRRKSRDQRDWLDSHLKFSLEYIDSTGGLRAQIFSFDGQEVYCTELGIEMR